MTSETSREREREWWLRPIRLRGWELLVFICSSCPYPHRLFIGKRSAYDIQVLDLLLVLGLEVHILVLASQDPILITLRFATASLQIGNLKYKIISAVAGARRGKHRSIYHHVGRAGPFSGTAQPCRPSLSNKADYLADRWHLHFSTTEITADLIDTSLSEVSCFFFRTFSSVAVAFLCCKFA